MRCLWSLSALLVLTGCGGDAPVSINQSEYGAKWPFTVERVELNCEDGSPSALVRTEDGKIYALNGSARSRASKNGWLDGRSISKPNPQFPGTTMDYSDISVRAMKLCPSYAG